MNKKLLSVIYFSLLLLLPAVALAVNFGAGDAPFSSINSFETALTFLGNILNQILNLVWIVFFVFSIIMFIWAGFQFLSAQGEPEGVKSAQKSLLWGVIAVAVAVIAFSLPRIIFNFLGGG